MEKEIFDSAVAAKIKKRFSEVQSAGSTGKIKKQGLLKILGMIAETRHGCIEKVGYIEYSDRRLDRCVDATAINIGWYTWRKKKWIVWDIERKPIIPALQEDSGRDFLSLNKRKAWEYVFSNRYRNYTIAKVKRTAKHLSVIVPDIVPEEISHATIVDEAYGMLLIDVALPPRPKDGYREHVHYLCAPLGYLKTDPYEDKIKNALRDMKIDIPSDKDDITWDDIEAAWIMGALAK